MITATSDEVFLGIFEQLVMDMEFDPFEQSIPCEDPAPWGLDDQYPWSLAELLSTLEGTDGSTVPEDQGHDRLRGSEGGIPSEEHSATSWSGDLGGFVAVHPAGSAGFPADGTDLPGAADGETGVAGVDVEAGE